MDAEKNIHENDKYQIQDTGYIWELYLRGREMGWYIKSFNFVLNVLLPDNKSKEKWCMLDLTWGKCDEYVSICYVEFLCIWHISSLIKIFRGK